MARSDPEKLAQALRANLRRRKAPPGLKDRSDGPAGGQGAPDAESPPEKSPSASRPPKR